MLTLPLTLMRPRFDLAICVPGGPISTTGPMEMLGRGRNLLSVSASATD